MVRGREAMNPSRRRIGIVLLLALTLAAAISLVLYGPIREAAGHNSFADSRTLLEIPNFWNVVSNLPFVFVGAWGLVALRSGRRPGVLPRLWLAWIGLLAGSLLIGFGSAYYHLAPTDASLAWDRLPMTVAFMSLLAIIIGERVGIGAGARLLGPLIVLGVGSVLCWHFSGDLRPYVLVQYVPMALIPIALILFPSPLRPVWPIWAGLASYALAKALEVLDARVFRMFGGIGGHPLKHLAAAIAIGFFVLAATRRHPV